MQRFTVTDDDTPLASINYNISKHDYLKQIYRYEKEHSQKRKIHLLAIVSVLIFAVLAVCREVLKIELPLSVRYIYASTAFYLFFYLIYVVARTFAVWNRVRKVKRFINHQSFDGLFTCHFYKKGIVVNSPICNGAFLWGDFFSIYNNNQGMTFDFCSSDIVGYSWTYGRTHIAIPSEYLQHKATLLQSLSVLPNYENRENRK